MTLCTKISARVASSRCRSTVAPGLRSAEILPEQGWEVRACEQAELRSRRAVTKSPESGAPMAARDERLTRMVLTELRAVPKFHFTGKEYVLSMWKAVFRLSLSFFAAAVLTFAFGTADAAA